MCGSRRRVTSSISNKIESTDSEKPKKYILEQTKLRFHGSYFEHPRALLFLLPRYWLFGCVSYMSTVSVIDVGGLLVPYIKTVALIYLMALSIYTHRKKNKSQAGS